MLPPQFSKAVSNGVPRRTARLTGSTGQIEEVRVCWGNWVEVCPSSEYHAQVVINIAVVVDSIRQVLSSCLRELKNALYGCLDGVNILVEAPSSCLWMALLRISVNTTAERGWKGGIEGGHLEERARKRTAEADVGAHHKSRRMGYQA